MIFDINVYTIPFKSLESLFDQKFNKNSNVVKYYIYSTLIY